jgi:hypothetical protein
MMMRGMIGQTLSADFSHNLAAEVEGVRQRRQASLAADGVLVIEVRGDTDAALKEPIRTIEDFVLCFDALDKKALSAALQPRIASILAAVRIGGAGSYELRRAGSGSLLSDNYICALTTITPEHPSGRGDASSLAATPAVRGAQPGANDGRASEEAHG